MTLTRQPHPVYTLFAASQAELPVRTLCKMLKVSASGFYC